MYNHMYNHMYNPRPRPVTERRLFQNAEVYCAGRARTHEKLYEWVCDSSVRNSIKKIIIPGITAQAGKFYEKKPSRTLYLHIHVPVKTDNNGEADLNFNNFEHV